MAQVKERKPWLAALLSFILNGLGHIYAGKVEKGVSLYSIGVLLVFISAIVLLFISFPFSFIICLIIILTIKLFTIIDSFNEAKKVKTSYEIKKYNKWYFYVIIYVLCAFLLSPILQIIIRNNLVQSYKMPAGSMLPSMQIGDHFLVNKMYYGFNEIKRGDIIVFKYPMNPERDFIKRVIGLPGENIEIKNQVVYINGKPLEESYIRHEQGVEEGTYITPRDNFGPLKIPPRNYFMMGDNRDSSMDSRYWGVLKEDMIKGKAYLVYWSSNKDTIRWERIGKNL